MAQNNRNFINGAFANKVGDYDLINIDISEDAIKAIQALPKNAKGMRRLTLGAQKNDPSKYSLYENTYTGKGGNAGSNSDSSDNLPF